MTDRVYGGVVRFALGAFRGLDLRIDVVGQEHVPAAGGAVVVMNHTGYLDFAIAGVPFWHAHRRLVRFMAKQEVFHHPVSGPLMRAMGHVPVDRSAGSAAFRAGVDALRSGELLGVFPEATISRSWELKEFKNGAVRMARAARVPVVPVALWGSQRVWTKGRRLSLRSARHVPVSITVGPPLDPKAALDPEAALRAEMQRLLDAGRARYPDGAPPGAWWVPAAMGGAAPTLEEATAIEAAERAARRSAVDEREGAE